MAEIPVNASDAVVVVDVVTDGQLVFDYDFRADDVADLRAIYRGTGEEVPLVGGIGFTATGLGTATGGTITLTGFTDTVAGAKVAIYRDTVIERLTDFARDLHADTLNAEQDGIFMILQELATSIGRAALFPIGTPPQIFPLPGNGKLIGFDNFGKLTVSETTIDERTQRINADAALASLIGAAGDVVSKVFDSRLAVTLAHISPLVGSIVACGYYTAGDVGETLIYYRAMSAPAYGGVQSADGAWWALANKEVSPGLLGAVGNGIADDTSPLAAFLELSALGRVSKWGDPNAVYRYTTPLELTASADIQWQSSGARLLYDGVITRRMFHAELNGKNFTLDGDLCFDANRKAFQCFSARNGSTTMVDLIASGLRARRAYRSSLSFVGGDGIIISGGLNKVLLTRPDVRDCLMAAGAGVAGSQGIFGITVFPAGLADNQSPVSVTITDPYIENIGSEDGWLFDQDAIRIFGNYNKATSVAFPSACHFNVRGGEIINVAGRALKSQAEWGTIRGTKITMDGRAGSPVAAGNSARPLIDFQVGGGNVRDVEVFLNGRQPEALVYLNATPVDTRLNMGGSVRGLKVLGGSGINFDEFIRVYLDRNPAQMVVNIGDVDVYLSNGTIKQFVRVGGTGAGPANRRAFVNLSDCVAPIGLQETTDAAWVFRAVNEALFVSGRNLSKPTGTACQFYKEAAGLTDTILKALDGLNINTANPA